MLARTSSQQPEGQRVGMADRLIHVPAGGIQRADEGGLIENKTMAVGARRGRRRQDPSLFRELRLVEDDREGAQISTVMRTRQHGDQRRVDATGQLAPHVHVAPQLRLHAAAQQMVEAIDRVFP